MKKYTITLQAQSKATYFNHIYKTHNDMKNETIYTAPMKDRLRWNLRHYTPLIMTFMLVFLWMLLPRKMHFSLNTSEAITPKVSQEFEPFKAKPYMAAVVAKEEAKPTIYILDEFEPERERFRVLQEYVRKYYKVAIEEQKLYGQPASVKLAQGILESQSGQSKLSLSSNNHFGIKCFSKTCSKGHCSNHTDDSHKDFFRNFETPKASWRAHSEFLQKERYANCKGKTAFEWCDCLKASGYATDPDYASTLKGLIEKYKLTDFDNLKITKL